MRRFDPLGSSDHRLAAAWGATPARARRLRGAGHESCQEPGSDHHHDRRQTYTDGKDTLPGYDDQLCTPIPGVQYDFAANEIQYYDGGGEP